MVHKMMPTVIVVALAGLAACAGRQGPAQIQSPEPARLTILLAGNTCGALTPTGCGCRSRGGLARRARVIATVLREDSQALVLDAGGLFAAPAGHGAPTEAELILQALELMHTDALNCTASDVATGRAALLGRGRTVQVLSANIQDTGEPVFAPWAVLRVHGLRVGMFGLAAPGQHRAFLPKPVSIASPIEAAREAIAALRRQGCDIVLLLSGLTAQQNRALARQVSGIDFILGSADPVPTVRPAAAGSTVLCAPGARGTHLIRIDITQPHPGAGFYNLADRARLEAAVRDLDTLERNPDRDRALEDVVLERTVLEKKLAAFAGMNEYRFQLIALDDTAGDDPAVAALVEAALQERVRAACVRAGQTYCSRIPQVERSGLPAASRGRAIRLMNDIDCPAGGSVAEGVASSPVCHHLAELILSGISSGDTDGEIRFRVLQSSQRRDGTGYFSLDNETALH